MEKTASFANLHKNNTRLKISELGEVELKYISMGDSQYIAEILENKGLTNKQFAKRILFNQLLKPKVTEEEFQQISDENLLKIAHAFIDKEQTTFKHYNDTSDFYLDFRRALQLHEEKQLEIITKKLKPFIINAQKSISAFNTNYASVIQQALDTSSYIKDTLQDISGLAKQINNINAQFAQPIQQFANQYAHLAGVINQSLKPQIDVWNNWAANNVQIFQNIGKFWKDFQEEYSIAEQKAVLVLQRYKWFITPGLPVTFVFNIMRLDKRRGRKDKAVNKVFVNYFSANHWKNAEIMVNSWKGKLLLRRRLKILQNCVLTLKRSSGKKDNPSDVVLPTLITQIDGLLSDYLSSKGIVWDCAYDDLVQNQKVRKIGRKSQFLTNRSKTMTTQLDDLANDIFLNILFQRSQKGKPLKTPFNFNRHKIIHGENTSYGRKDYVVRAFMIIDFLAHLK